MEHDEALTEHPLFDVFMEIIEHVQHGKGQRHGGGTVEFMDQPWVHYATMHGRGFLTGQAAKKLEEAAATRTGHAFKTEMQGAIVYAAMAILFEQQDGE